MADFNTAVLMVLEHEGGFSDVKDDHGGPTNMGITKADLAMFFNVPKEEITTEQVKSITPDLAKQIYKKFYWDKLKLDTMPSQCLATVAFDLGILRGTGRIHLDLFKAQEITANPIAQAYILTSNSVTHFLNIADRDTSQKKFLAGWMNRIADLVEFIVLWSKRT